MINSIQQFQTEGVKNLEKVFVNYSADITKIAEMVAGVTGERCYLLDRLMGFGQGERLTEDAVARILEEAVDSSYRKGGLAAGISSDAVSKGVKETGHSGKKCMIILRTHMTGTIWNAFT